MITVKLILKDQITTKTPQQEEMWGKGMVGLGRTHKKAIKKVMERTGLPMAKVEVSYFNFVMPCI